MRVRCIRTWMVRVQCGLHIFRCTKDIGLSEFEGPWDWIAKFWSYYLYIFIRGGAVARASIGKPSNQNNDKGLSACVCETCLVWLQVWLAPEVANTPGLGLITFESEGRHAIYPLCYRALASGEFCLFILSGLAARGWGFAWVAVARGGARPNALLKGPNRPPPSNLPGMFCNPDESPSVALAGLFFLLLFRRHGGIYITLLMYPSIYLSIYLSIYRSVYLTN